VHPDREQDSAASQSDSADEAGDDSADAAGLEALAPAPGPTPTVPPFGEGHMWSDGTRDYQPGPLPLGHHGPARVVETGVLTAGRTVDRLQSGIAPIAFGYAVMKKYFDDEGSRLAAVMAYYTFLSLFPLMIGGVAILNLLLRNDPERAAEIIADVVPEQFQDQILASYEALPSGGTALAVALVGLLLAGTGGGFALYATLNQVFAVPYRYRYGFGPRYARIIAVVFIMAFAVVVTSAGGGIVGAWFDVPVANRVAAALLTAAIFSASLYGSAHLLCRRPLAAHDLLLGAVLGGVIVTAIVSLGSWLVSSFVATSTPIYGAFATVIGVISVLVLTSNGLVLALEISVVRAWQLWPRGIDIHLLFPADERAYVLLSLMDERMPSQRNDVRFDADGHFDPRRPGFGTLNHRQPGVPRTPYEDA
jgi:membrane protein